MGSWTLEEPTTLTFDQVRRLRVGTVEGTVSVVGGDGPPTLEVSELAGAPLQVRLEDGQLEVDYERPEGRGPLAWLTDWHLRYRAALSLRLPRDCQVELRVVSASVMVTGLRGPVRARSVSGEITLAGLHGQVEAETVSGTVQASGVAGDLSAHSVSGDLTLVEGGGGAVRARTVSGAIAVDLRASGDREIRLSSISGDLTVRLPDASDLQVQLQSTGGQVATAFEELARERAPGMHAVHGRLGAGTGRLKATSTSGHVALLRGAPEASL
jgi:hypothetical protein